MAVESASVAPLVPLSTAFRVPLRFCRLCMGSGPLQRLFKAGGEDPVNPELVREIRNLVGIEIVCPDDQLSAICSRCVRSLEDFFFFRNRCQAVDVRVRELRTGKVAESSLPSTSPPTKPTEKVVRDKLGIFSTAEFCRDPTDGPDVYRLVREGFVYQHHRNLFEWRCEVIGCGCRLTVDKDLNGCRVLGEHDHEVERGAGREVFKINPEVWEFLNGLSKVDDWSMEQVANSTVAESVLNIVEYPQDDDPVRLPEAPNVEVANCTPEPEVSFFNCLDRGLSMVRGGFHFLLAQVHSVGGSSWHCTWSSCQVTLEADSQLTSFKASSEHCHPAPDRSVLLETTGVPVSQYRVLHELSVSPTNDGQNPQPEVTFYRVDKSVIGVRYDGFCFRLAGFNADESESLWNCTWNECTAQLGVSGKLNCRMLVSANEWTAHDHQRPAGPLCSVVNIISPVKALVELNGKRCVMARKDKESNGTELLEGMPTPQLKLTKVAITPRLQEQLEVENNADRIFFRYKRSLCLKHEANHYQLIGFSRNKKNRTSQWSCATKIHGQKCPVTVELRITDLAIVSVRNQHHHRPCSNFPAELKAKPFSAEDAIGELKRASRRRQKRGPRRVPLALFQLSGSSFGSTLNEGDPGGSSYRPSSSELSG